MGKWEIDLSIKTVGTIEDGIQTWHCLNTEGIGSFQFFFLRIKITTRHYQFLSCQESRIFGN